jgi:xanthine dehydrogenase YagS FAD-binding subunit
MGGVGTRPWRNAEAERVLLGKVPGEQAFRDAAETVLREARPRSQNGFKVELARRCIVQALKQVTS